jgi:hypothetical protein
MGPEYLVVGAILGVVLVLAIAFGLVAYGASTRTAEVEILQERVGELNEDLAKAERRFRLWAAGAASAARRDHNFDAAGDDFDRMLRVWADEDADGAPPAESGRAADSSDATRLARDGELGCDDPSTV